MLKLCQKCLLTNLRETCKLAISQQLYHAKSKTKIVPDQRPIISCKRKEYDFYPGEHIDKYDDIKLASKGWHNKKSKGDYFILHMSDVVQFFDHNKTYNQFGLNNQLLSNLNTRGILYPTTIQSKAIPSLLARNNTLIAAETGCGKTLAYIIPALQQIITSKLKNKVISFNSPLCLILTPNRELAYQIENVAKSISQELNINTDVIVGGGTKKKMLNPTFKETDLLVATPGALSKLTTTGIYKMSEVKHVILDEADSLLDDSFSEKMGHFLKKFAFHYSGNSTENIGTQLTIVSATMPSVLPNVLSEIILIDSLHHISTDRLHKILPHVSQRFLRVTKSMRPSQLLQMVKFDADKKYPVMIFSNKSNTCDWITMFLTENGIECSNLNGNVPLALRQNKFYDFQRGMINVISCTDIGSRGLDTTRVKHIINFDFPKFTADYIHRCGRIGRIGSPINCHVTNFVASYDEIDIVQKIEMSIRRNECLPNVNGNISGIYKQEILKSIKANM